MPVAWLAAVMLPMSAPAVKNHIENTGALSLRNKSCVCVCVYHQLWKFARTAGITTGYRKEESLLGHQYSIGLSFYPDGECLIWAAE